MSKIFSNQKFSCIDIGFCFRDQTEEAPQVRDICILSKEPHQDTNKTLEINGAIKAASTADTPHTLFIFIGQDEKDTVSGIFIGDYDDTYYGDTSFLLYSTENIIIAQGVGFTVYANNCVFTLSEKGWVITEDNSFEED